METTKIPEHHTQLFWQFKIDNYDRLSLITHENFNGNGQFVNSFVCVNSVSPERFLSGQFCDQSGNLKRTALPLDCIKSQSPISIQDIESAGPDNQRKMITFEAKNGEQKSCLEPVDQWFTRVAAPWFKNKMKEVTPNVAQ